MSRLKTRLLGILLWFLLFSISCASHRPKPEDAIEAPIVLREEMSRHRNTLISMRIPEVILEYYGDKERLKVRQLILVEAPNKIRIQTRVPASDEIMSLLVSSDGVFAMHDRQTNQYVTGPATPKNISRLLPVDLSPSDFVRIMFGDAPWDKFDQLKGSQMVTWDDEKGEYRYETKDKNGHVMRIYVDPAHFTTTEVELFKGNGESLWHYTTDEWVDDHGFYLPKFRRFMMPSKKIDFSLETPTVEINPELNDLLFEFEPPVGSKIIQFK